MGGTKLRTTPPAPSSQPVHSPGPALGPFSASLPTLLSMALRKGPTISVRHEGTDARCGQRPKSNAHSVRPMPMIDVYAPRDIFPAETEGLLGRELTMAVLRAEGVATPGPFHLNNTAAFVHLMDPHAVHTAATNSARSVRVQVITPPAALTREGQKQLVKEITEIVTKVSGDPTLSS